MKRKDFVLIAGIIVIALISYGLYTFMARSHEEMLQISVHGEVYGTYSLEEDQIIEINNTNVCEIRSGRVTMTQSNCPDHLCENQASIDVRGGSIVCLPNRVVLAMVDIENDGVYDGVTG